MKKAKLNMVHEVNDEMTRKWLVNRSEMRDLYPLTYLANLVVERLLRYPKP